MPSPEITKIAERILAKASKELTPKELALIKQLCLPNKIIAQNLNIEVPTVKMRVARLATKFGAETRAAIMVKALKRGLVTIDELAYRERYD